jgi:integrase
MTPVTIPLSVLPRDSGGSRVTWDRVELLTALIGAPGFDPLYRTDIITIPPHHPVYAWCCTIAGCERPRRPSDSICHVHHQRWRTAEASGQTRTEFLRAAEPLAAAEGIDVGCCRICPDRPAHSQGLGLCSRHRDRWKKHADRVTQVDFERWVADQTALPGYGTCRVAVCPYLATSPLGLCDRHLERYNDQGRPGDAVLPPRWHRDLELHGRPIPVLYDDEAQFHRWCATEAPLSRLGVINLIGLAPLAKAEIQWGLYAHTQVRDRASWDLGSIQKLVNHCRRRAHPSLAEVDADDYAGLNYGKVFRANVRMICRAMITSLRCVYYSPADTKDAGFIETDHFGRRFTDSGSTFDLTGVPQRWLRDLLWDHLAAQLQSAKCPRSRAPFHNARRACTELGTFLATDAPDGGHDPSLLRAEHAQRFVADQRHRARHRLPSLGQFRKNGQPSTVTASTCSLTFNYARTVLRGALESGQTARIGLATAFVAAIPGGGSGPRRSRSPYSDQVARALADEENLRLLAETHDPKDRGLRDVWETIIVTGRRCGEVLKLRLDCIGRYGTLPMLWHDQTKVGNYDEGIRIPEPLYVRIDQRRTKTIARFERRHGRLPTPAERAVMALFPRSVRNPTETGSISYGMFSRRFRAWVDDLELGAAVAHQARHTLATNLLRAGASLAQIRKYLGHVSDRMAEHYTKIAHSELEDVLQTVWVAGPGAPNPGELLSGDPTPLTREQALALAVDLSRRSTPAEGGFCTFQPVVNGAACPWKLDCHNCDKFVLSGADLLYWRRKQEQWRSIAERAPDDATADYLHQVFEPTARAIEGLEKALAGLGLLNQALAVDLRRPQDYFHRIWSTNFHVTELATLSQPDTRPKSTRELT